MIKGSIGIEGWGVSIPYSRIALSEIASAWEKPKNPGDSLKVIEKAVPNFDEDAVTLAVEAADLALKRAGVRQTDIGAVFIGSESHPYVVKPSSGIVAEALGINPFHLSADLEFACKAGTTAIQIVASLVASEIIDSGIAIGADTSQGAPGDILEYTASSGAGAYVIGKKRIVAQILDTLSYTTDTPDFWRKPGEVYPKHAGRFTAEPSYFKHIEEAVRAFLQKTKTKPHDYNHVIFHMPNGKFPRVVAKKLGFTESQVKYGLTVDYIGNPYSASSLIGLARVLDYAKSAETILVASYGSGAGSDVISFETTKNLSLAQKKARSVDDFIKHKNEVSYTKYIRMRGKLR